jgi:hypothetical protein
MNLLCRTCRALGENANRERCEKGKSEKQATSKVRVSWKRQEAEGSGGVQMVSLVLFFCRLFFVRLSWPQRALVDALARGQRLCDGAGPLVVLSKRKKKEKESVP